MLIALAVAVAIIGIFAGPLMAIVLMYIGLLAGNGVIVTAKSSICKK